MRLSAQMKGWKGHGAITCVVLLLLVAPRLITAAPLDMLQGNRPDSQTDPSEISGENFPGSAFFYAEGAFDPAPGVETLKSQHVLGLDAVKSAPAMIFRGITGLDSYRALHCLTSAIYYEAANEPDDGQRAVAQVVLNRVRSPLYPNTVCGVVYQGSERTDYKCQFTFSCDGAMARLPAAAAWVRARRVAERALAGDVYAPVGLATHYHTLAVRPDWSSSLQAVAVIGAHIFYRSPGFNGTPAAFRIPYLGREPISGPARNSWPAKPVQPIETMTPSFTLPLTASQPAAPTTTWTPPPTPRPADDGLPESTIRPEYRNSGRPLI
ncbi:cell wall hydrolase [Sphingobium sp.]|uniref:cell wall hydrolase n=1 Tax=Sphingobium sp. TaxID=1912891 RepID=UPI003B3AC55F